MKLDWSKIDNEKTFQNFVNHLFYLECPSSFGFIPFSPYRGKDGGWDGKYEGFYPSENLSGKFCIQAKFTRKNLNDAMPSLKEWATEELTKAKTNQVDHLRLATSADLRDEHLTQLHNLNEGHVKTFKAWHGHDLLMRAEREPFLVSHYFGGPTVPLFVPASFYFESNAKNAVGLEENIKGIKSIDDRLVELAEFLRRDEKKLFILHAPGGYGKSHFLRELPTQAASCEPDREIWFIRDGVRNFQEAFNDEIGARESANKKHKYLLVLDDADRASDVQDILMCVIKSGLDIKLVLALRTAGIFALNEIIDSVRARDLSQQARIPDWTDDELKALLHAKSGQNKVDQEDQIVRQFSNPFFIVRIGSNIKSKGTYDFQSTKNSILETLLNDSRKILKADNIRVEDLLLNLSLIAPINISDISTLAKLAQQVSCDERKLKELLEKLCSAGVLRKIGAILRFVPDMIGDIYLLQSMEQISEAARKQIFLYWLESHSKNIFCNLGATLRYGSADCLVPIASDVVSGWMQESSNYDEYDKRRILENLEEIYHLVPNEAVNLLWEFLKNPDLSTDGYGPLIVRLIHSDLDREEVVKIIEVLRAKVKQGTYDNYKPNTLVRESLTPLKNNIDKQIMPILGVIANSLKTDNPIVEFAKAALEEVLASAHEWSRSTYAAMEFGTRSLRVTDSVLQMRKRALEITKTMAEDARSGVRLAAVEIASQIGKSRTGLGSADVPLKDTIRNERQEMFSFIKDNDLIKHETDWVVLNAYEDLLFGWWARQEIDDDKVLPMLGQIAYSPEYRIFRYYSSRWDISEDVRDRLKSAPSEGRWPWVVDNIMQRKWNLAAEHFEKDAKLLNEKYADAKSVANFLCDLGKRVTVSSANAVFLRAWINENPDIFKEIRQNKSLWCLIPNIFKYTITYDLVQKFPDLAKTIIEEVLLTVPQDIEESKIAIDILSYDIPSLNKFEIIKSVAEKNLDELNLTIIQRLRFIGNKLGGDEVGRMVLEVLSHMSISAKAKSMDDISFIFHGKNAAYIDAFLAQTHEKLYEILVDDGKLDYHDFEIATHLIADIKELCAFLESRFQKQQDINKYSEYEAVPFDGIGILAKLVKSEDDYYFALLKAIDWDSKYVGIASFSVDKYFEQIASLKNSSDDLYLDKIKDRFKDKDLYSKLISCLSHLHLNRLSIDLFKDALQKCHEFGCEDLLINILRRKIYPEGGWTSSVGDVPPAFIERKEIFTELERTAPAGKLKSAVGDCIKGVVQMMEDHKREEENRFHSR